MNKDRRVIVQVLSDLTKAYSSERSVPNKVLIVLRDAVKDLAATEERSLKRMEPFKDAPGTAQNYANGYDCWEDLLAAQEALEEGELDEAYPLLQRVATGSTVPGEPQTTDKIKRPNKKPSRPRKVA